MSIIVSIDSNITYLIIRIKITVQGFPYWVDGGSHPPLAKNLLTPPPSTWKNSPFRRLPPIKILSSLLKVNPPPLNNDFHNDFQPIKTFLAVVVVPVVLFLF